MTLARPFIDVVYFAGAGGSSEAYRLALGRDPDIALNHNSTALSVHQVNFPNTEHFVADVFDVDPRALRPGVHWRSFWASPDCRHFSKAKGGAPVSPRIRGLAWIVVKVAKLVHPDVIFLENVEEFQDWGPLLPPDAEGRQQPDPARRGQTFRLWRKRLEQCGYVVEHRELIAADYGAPTTRKRLFLVARCDGKPVVWPSPTHAPRAIAQGKGLKPYRAAAEIIDWSVPTRSIFGRARPLQPKTCARIAKGIKRYVIDAAHPFIVPVTHSAGRNATRSAAEPLPTITTAKGGEFAVSAPSIMPLTHGGRSDRCYDARAPLPTVTGAHRGELAQSASLLVRTDMQSAYLRNGVHSVEDPLRTITTRGGLAEVESSLAPFVSTYYGDGNGGAIRGSRLDEPIRTIPTANRHAVAAATVALAGASVGVGGRAGQSPPRGLDDPLHTVTAKADRAWAIAHLTKFSENSIGTDPGEPLHTAMAGAPRHGLVSAYLGRQFGSTVSARDLNDPHPTVMTDGGGGKSQVVAAHLTRNFGRSVGSAAEAPIGTITSGGGGKTSLSSAIIDKYYGSGVGAAPTEPLDTATAKARFGLGVAFMEQANTGMVGHDARAPLSTIVGRGTTQRLIELVLDGAGEGRRRDVLSFLWQHFGEPTDAEIAEPLTTPQGRLRLGLLVLDGVVWQIVDIGMRMLLPKELAGAQGFGAHYITDRNARGEPVTKTEQTRQIGNSVSPMNGAAVIACNLDPEPGVIREAA